MQTRFPDAQFSHGFSGEEYPIFADFIASDDELYLLPRFGPLNARVILALQDEICQLEEEIKNLDHKYVHCTELVNNGSFRQDVKQDRKDILNRLRSKLKEYSWYSSDPQWVV
jgi:hypothetical protein